MRRGCSSGRSQRRLSWLENLEQGQATKRVDETSDYQLLYHHDITGDFVHISFGALRSPRALYKRQEAFCSFRKSGILWRQISIRCGAIQGVAIEDNQSTSGCALCALIVSVFPYSTSRCNLRTLDLTSLYCRGKFHNTKEKTIVMAIVQGNPKDVVSPYQREESLTYGVLAPVRPSGWPGG